MFDTLKYTKKLIEAGVSRDLAESHIRIIAEISEENLTTKEEIDRLMIKFEANMRERENRMMIRLGGIMVAGITVLSAIIGILNYVTNKH